MATVVVADPHKRMSEAIVDALSGVPDIAVVARASTRSATASALARHHPDVLLIDPAVLGRGGLASLRLLGQASTATAVLVMAMDDAPTWAAHVTRSGAAGYVSKRSHARDFRRAVMAAATRSRQSPAARNIVPSEPEGPEVSSPARTMGSVARTVVPRPGCD